MRKSLPFFRKFHKWLGLLIGLQLLLWTAGGLVMSFFDIDEVRGTHNMAQPLTLTIDDKTMISSNQVLDMVTFKPQNLTLKFWQDKLVWQIEAEQDFAVIDATTGLSLSPFSLSQAQAVAVRDFVGDGQLISHELLDEVVGEVRGREPPLWRFQFDDGDNTRIYVSQKTGQVVARRNDTWRFYDFFWMLHIMDYQERSNFNNPLLIFAALLGVLMSLSGLYLVIRLVFGKKKRVNQSL